MIRSELIQTGFGTDAADASGRRVGTAWLPRSIRNPVAFLCGALWLLGLVRSAVICLRRQPDADMATVPLVYEAVRRHGLSALSTWHYTQDNWLLSVIVPELPLHALLTPCPWLPALTGWGFFVGGCIIAALLARPVVGRTTAALLGGTLLFASPAGLTGFGFLAHPASHDVTTFWCLLALLPAASCLNGRSPLLLLPVTAAALVVATISDPWAQAAFLLPLLLAALVTMVASTGRMRWVAALIALATLPAWLAGSHAFGLMPTLTQMHLNRGPLSALPAHLLAGVTGLGLLFGGNGLLSAVIPTGVAWQAAPGLCVLGLLLALAVVALWRRGLQPSTPAGFLMVVCLLSSAGTLSAFGLSAFPADVSFTRLMLNSYVTLPLFLCLALGGWSWRVGAAALGAASVLFVAGGLSDRWEPVREHSVGAAGWQTRLTGFLEAHHLHYGYGGYWGSDANSSRVRTCGAVTIRPVSAPGGDLPIGPNGSQVFDDWYDPGDAGVDGPTRFFVSVPEPGLCLDPGQCRALAVRSFGQPERILTWERHEILVWSHPILFRRPDEAVLSGVPPIGSVPRTGFALEPYLWTGWGLPDAGVSWMNGHEAVLMMPADTVPQCVRLRAASGSVQMLRLRVGDAVQAVWPVAPGPALRHCMAPHAQAAAMVLEHGAEDGDHPAAIVLESIERMQSN
ncbi:MAG: hypothetical protein ACRYG8_54370 [Janthinobacterium lividum]